VCTEAVAVVRAEVRYACLAYCSTMNTEAVTSETSPILQQATQTMLIPQATPHEAVCCAQSVDATVRL
jgi:hypothetical protein